jgi:tetratricopeptide (TPR) repeat protein
LTRTYHNTTLYYNVYFNGKEALKTGLNKIDKEYKDNYSLILPVFKFSKKEAVMVAYADMNRVIEKGSKGIRKHSIKVKPKRKEGKKRDPKYKEFYNQKEFVKWIDDCYLLIGKGNFYKHDFYPAIEIFNYIVKEYSDKPIKYDGYLWLTRTYTLMDKYDKANDFLSKLETDKDKIPKRLIGPIAVTKADIQIRTQHYDLAIPYLIKAIPNTKDKKKKERYQYILAQLYQEIDEYKKAYEAYGKVVEMNPDYEMTFNARINRASIFNASDQDSKELQKELNKMLKDAKNIDFKDQIYYALGNIAFKESREKDALNYYLLSAQSSKKNNNQKALSYLAVADIYFDKPNYKNAKIYYDSTMTFLSKEYPDYNQLKNKTDNLKSLVENIEIIEREDSLQTIAKMSTTQRNAFIDNIIAKVVEKERKEREELIKKQQELSYLQQQGQQMTNNNSGKWYFYNPTMMAMGQSEFTKKWGDRKDEDNWRRKNKSAINWDEFNNNATDSVTVDKKMDNKTREYYLADIPLTDSTLQLSKQKEEDAYFNMAYIYKEKFNDFPLSIDGYLQLLKNYPDTKYKLQSYYNLYKLYYLTKEYKKAEEYKNIIISQYPDSEYAKVLSDPEYFKQLEKIDNQIKFMYKATYKFFINNNCSNVYRNYRYADSTYHSSKYIPKFALLSTLCIGHSGDSVAFTDSLINFIKYYPNTEEAEYAKEVLSALDRSPREVVLEKKEETFGDDLNSTANLDSVSIDMYKFNPNSKHHYIVIIDNKKANANRIKFNLINFNLDYYSFLEFNVNSELLSAEYTLVDISTFKNKSMATNYLESIEVVGDIFDNTDNDAYKIFIISESNLKTFKTDKSILRYQKFFNINYLGKK